jgi:hypothetical protein
LAQFCGSGSSVYDESFVAMEGKMEKWEFTMVHVYQDSETNATLIDVRKNTTYTVTVPKAERNVMDILSELGQDGWDVVSNSIAHGAHVILLKRPLAE